MPMRSCAFVVILFLSSVLFPMEQSLSEPQLAIMHAAATYQDHLLQSLGCAVCAAVEKFVETDHFIHVRNRLIELRTLRNLVKAPAWPDKVSRFLDAMGKFNSLAGKRFKSACIAAVKRADSPHDESEESCVKCWERTRFVMAHPCHHLLYCDPCAEELAEDHLMPITCALCRHTVEKYKTLNEVLETCLGCTEEARALAAECGHLVLCMKCAAGKTHCVLCDKACEKFEQVYR